MHVAILACSGDSPTSPAGRTIPVGTYNIEFRGCLSCPFNTTPGNLLLFQSGVRATIQVVSSDELSTTIRYTDVRFGESNIDVSDRLESPTLVLDWEEVAAGGPAYLGRMSWGGSGLMTQTIRRKGAGIECGFAMFDPNLVFGPGSCTVRP